jgi:hypothetical protein
LIPIYENRYYFGKRFGLEDQAGNTPFEVAQGFSGVLVYATFREDMNPGELPRCVCRWGRKVVDSVGRVGESAGREWIVCGRNRGRRFWGSRERLGGEETDCLDHGWLEEASVDRV